MLWGYKGCILHRLVNVMWLGPVVQNLVSLTTLLMTKSLTAVVVIIIIIITIIVVVVETAVISV